MAEGAAPTQGGLLAAGRKQSSRASAARTLVPSGVLMQFALGCRLDMKTPCSVNPEGCLGFQ